MESLAGIFEPQVPPNQKKISKVKFRKLNLFTKIQLKKLNLKLKKKIKN